VVHQHPGQGITHFGKLCSSKSSPRSQKSDESTTLPSGGAFGEDLLPSLCFHSIYDTAVVVLASTTAFTDHQPKAKYQQQFYLLC